MNFYDYIVYMPNILTAGPVLSSLLYNINNINITYNDSLKPEYVYRLAKEVQTVYKEYNVSNNFHQGTSSNVAVMDLNDNYVSVVT